MQSSLVGAIGDHDGYLVCVRPGGGQGGELVRISL
jgi:hypothetical protein